MAAKPPPRPIRLLPRQASYRPYTGILRLIGIRWESEIAHPIMTFEPGYNPVRRHFTEHAARHRCERWLNPPRRSTPLHP